MKLRFATPKDFSLFPHVPGEAFTLAMEVDGTQVAYAHFYEDGDVNGMIGLVDLYVDPQFQGNGYGKALLQELSKNAISNRGGQLQWRASEFEAAVGTLRPYRYIGNGSDPISA